MAFTDSPATNKELVKKLRSKYKVKILGEPTLLLGIHIQRDRPNQSIILSQKQYILKILEKARMKDAKPVQTPMNPNVLLIENKDYPEQKKGPHTSNEYATRIGELLYAAHAT